MNKADDGQGKPKKVPIWKLTPYDLKQATGTADPKLMSRLVDQATAALWIFENTPDDEKILRADALLSALKGIAPQNEMEGMLAVQMVSTHNAAMECLRRAMLPGQTFEGRDQNLKHAAKLMGIYIQQLDTLDKRRGKGQQKITVEHVNVHAGGQAIVGSVEAAARPLGAAPTTPPPAALPDRSGEAMPLIEESVAEKVPSKPPSRQARR